MNLKIAKNATMKMMALTATVLTLSLTSPLLSNANGLSNNGKFKLSGDQVSVVYAGTKDNSYAFSVQYDNSLGQKFQLIVKNDEGVVVYQEQFNDVHFTKTLLLPKDLGEIHPTFIIRTGNQQVEHSFTASTKVTENIVVSKS